MSRHRPHRQPDDLDPQPDDGDAAAPERSEDQAAEAAGAAAQPAAPEQQLAELQDKWLRARAEIENVRRAGRQDVEQARRYGAAPVLLALVDVLDNLQRALAQPPAGMDEEFLRGLKLIEQQFLAALASHGVTPVPADRGQPFDPNLHRALLEQPTGDVPPGTILQVVVPGYRLHDRLLREAHVVVARPAAPAAS